jgi:hypothetical protein
MITAAESPPPAPPRIIRRRPTAETKRKLRTDFVQGRGSMTSLGLKYGVSLTSVKAWSKREKWSELKTAFSERALENTVLPVPEQPASLPVLSPQQTRIARVERELERLELAMDKAHAEDGTCNAQTVRDVSAAHSRLFDVWCTLTGTPRPGVRKVSKPGRSLAPIIAPTESTAQAVESQPLPE